MEINAKLACYLLVFFVSITASGPVCSEPSNPESRSSGASGPVKIKLVSLADRLSRPVGLTHAGDGSHRLFIVEQRGTVRILKDGILSRSPFLDIRDRVRSGGEMGLLGLAFHPHFPKDRRFFVNYTSPENGLQTVISEFSADVQLEKADPASERRLLVVSQPFSNHNGGQIAFGLDGFLYIGTGDGGAGNDPHGNGQNLRSLLGKMLRIDVDRKDSNKNYAVPKDNPFTNQKHIAPEIWAYGLRNPWRFSFDTQTGDLLVGDVGQNRREEIDLIQRGRNYGWNIMEGSICTPGVNRVCDKSPFAKPLFDYSRSEGTVVIGGYVYRGKQIPALSGTYLYGDFGSGRIWMLRYRGPKVSEQRLLLESDRAISAFGQDEAGELYVVDYRGEILKVVKH